MAEKIIQAIVLKTIDYQDFDKIVTVYSDKYGKLSFIALGVNKPQSKNSYSLNTFSFSEFEIFKSRSLNSLSKLKTGNIIKTNASIAKNYNNYLLASSIISIVLQEQHFLSKNYKLFKMLEISLNKISNNKNPFSTLVWFIFYSLKYYGAQWDLNKCYRCGQKSRIYRLFDFNKYGLVCHSCFNPQKDVKQDVNFVEYLIGASKSNFENIFDEKMNVSYEIILSKLLFMYLTAELGLISLPISELLLKPIYEDDTFKEYTYNVLTK